MLVLPSDYMNPLATIKDGKYKYEQHEGNTMIQALGKNRRAIAWDTLVIWILVIIGLLVIFLIVALSGEKMNTLVDKLADIFRFGS